jgi:DNA mismatch repair ATPase MutS
LLNVIAGVGEVDAAISIASYRAGTTGWTRPHFLPPGAPAVFEGIRHPLLTDAVPNSLHIDATRGVIVTGSNMSGKTTFLRTVGVSTVLAQTINTCIADRYDAPPLMVRSCIGRADDPASGKSYYLVEVDAVLATVHAAAGARAHLLLFDELFRGTNAVERIAAGEAVLRALVAPQPDGRRSEHIVLAATHDQELVDLLDPVYAAFHFTDTVTDDDLSFDYRLQSGPSTTRNAIALLRLREAPAELVARALTTATDLERIHHRS